ncbi:hypothetical protein EDD21DRAFT_335413, partial [Dissophora ornata]
MMEREKSKDFMEAGTPRPSRLQYERIGRPFTSLPFLLPLICYQTFTLCCTVPLFGTHSSISLRLFAFSLSFLNLVSVTFHPHICHLSCFTC